MTDQKLSITVVTPSLNAERYLAECLQSVRSQSYPGIEHIVVDGGSTDTTVAIATAAKDVRVLSRPGLNQSASINVGLAHASGEIVAWLNADDLYMPNALARVAAAFGGEPELDVLVGDCDVVDQRGEFLWRYEPGEYDLSRLLRRGNYLAQPAVFLRRNVFDRVGYLDESLEFAMDYDLWLRLKHVRVGYTPVVLATFRWHSNSKSARNLKGNWTELLVIARRHGGGWTFWLAWSYARARLTSARLRVMRRFLRRSD